MKYILENYKLIKKLFFNKFAKNKKIMKFLKLNKTQPSNQLFVKLEFHLFNILLRSHLVFFLNDLFFFIKNNYIYVNGNIVNNPFFKINVGDRIQLIIFKNYYLFFKSNLLIFYKNLFKIKLKI
jgi:ribosomal protein S4